MLEHSLQRAALTSSCFLGPACHSFQLLRGCQGSAGQLQALALSGLLDGWLAEQALRQRVQVCSSLLQCLLHKFRISSSKPHWTDQIVAPGPAGT